MANMCVPPKATAFGDIILSANVEAPLFSDWPDAAVALERPEFCDIHKPLELEKAPEAAICIRLPRRSCPFSSLPFLPSGGKSSILPV